MFLFIHATVYCNSNRQRCSALKRENGPSEELYDEIDNDVCGLLLTKDTEWTFRTPCEQKLLTLLIIWISISLKSFPKVALELHQDYLAHSHYRFYIDAKLLRFITVERLHGKVDCFDRIVQIHRPHNKNWQYQLTIKQSDLLSDRIQKLMNW